MEYRNSRMRTHAWRLAVVAPVVMLLAAHSIPAQTSGQDVPIAARGLVTLMRDLTDRDGDGVPEFLDRYQESAYDERGNRIRFAEHIYYQQSDRWLVKIVTSSYDGASNLIYEKTSSDSPGSAFSERWLDRDARGNVIEDRLEHHSSLGVETIERQTFRYDERGNLVEKIREHYSSEDLDGLQRWTFTYDRRGNLLREVEERDNGNDGLFEIFVESGFTYDERGNLLEEERSYSGSVSSRVSSSYDAAGKVQETVIEVFNADLQLKIDQRTEYAYEPTGAQIDRHDVVRQFDDAGQWETVERWFTYWYDPRGNLIRLQVEDLDGNYRGKTVQSSQLDPTGRPLEVSIITDIFDSDSQVRKTFGSVRTYLYDEWGNLVEETYRSHRDGVRTWTTSRLYEY